MWAYYTVDPAVLPTGRLFGRISQKVERPDKSAAEFWPILYRKGPTSRKCILTSLFTLILGKFKKYYNVATDIDKDNFCV